MTGGPIRDEDAVPAVRSAIRRWACAAREQGHLGSGELAVAVSGGADSLALAAGAGYLGRQLGLRSHGLVVDHGLQPGSAAVAERAAAVLRELGLATARVLTVEVGGPGGLEAAARRARYAALRAALPAPDALVLLGHTRDDQAETVLLGLGRGSGPRSIAGMRPLDPPWGRPLLDIPRRITVAACARLGLRPWTDPHNSDPRFTRVRLRTEVLPLLDDVLSGGVAGALARTAAQLREDGEALDEWAARVLDRARERTRSEDTRPGETRPGETGPGETGPGETGPGETGPGETGPEETRPGEEEARCLAVTALADVPAAVRRRVLRRWLLDGGVSEITDAQLRSADDLVGAWRGQGGVWLPGGLVVGRAHGRLTLDHSNHRVNR